MYQVFKPLPYFKSSDLVVMLNCRHYTFVDYLIMKGILDTRGNAQPGYEKWIYKIYLQFHPQDWKILLTPIGLNGVLNWMVEDNY